MRMVARFIESTKVHALQLLLMSFEEFPCPCFINLKANTSFSYIPEHVGFNVEIM